MAPKITRTRLSQIRARSHNILQSIPDLRVESQPRLALALPLPLTLLVTARDEGSILGCPVASHRLAVLDPMHLLNDIRRLTMPKVTIAVAAALKIATPAVVEVACETVCTVRVITLTVSGSGANAK